MRLFIKKRLLSFKFAFNGLFTLVKEESNARIHFIFLSLVTILGFALKISTSEWLILLLCFALVISMELLNSAIESLADALTKDHNLHIKKAKNLAAGAVLWSAIIAAITGLLIFMPKILKLLPFN